MSERAYKRRHPLDMGRQLHALRALDLPDSKAQPRGRGVRFTYTAQPTPLSRRYDLELSHHRGNPPEVCVLSPDLTALARERDPLPHVYTKVHPVRLCLYLPGAREWGAEKLLAQTLVPWSIDWLFHFEIWLATGEWEGGGVHLPASSQAKAKRKTRPQER